jgi:hypothetical protein
MRNPLVRILLLAACLFHAASTGAEVYRWTDANGQVHYGERPPPEGARRLDLPPAGAAVDTDPDMAGRRDRQQRLLESYEYERTQRQADAARAAEERADDAERCRALERRWRELSHGGPVYFTGPDGSRDYLTEARRASEKEKMRPAFRRFCGREPG